MASRASVHFSFGLMPYISSWWFHTALRANSIPQQVADSIHAFGVIWNESSAPIYRNALQSPRFYAILNTERRWWYEKELQLLGNPSKHSAIQIKADFTYSFKRLPCYKFDCICNFITRNTPLDTWSCFLFSCIYFSSIVWQEKRSMGLVGYHLWHSAFACHFSLLYPFVWPISILCRHSGTSYHFNGSLLRTSIGTKLRILPFVKSCCIIVRLMRWLFEINFGTITSTIMYKQGVSLWNWQTN